MIVLDASVVIAFLDGEDRHHAAAEKLLAEAVEDDVAVNSLTLVEVLVVPARDERLAQTQAALRDLGIAELPFPADTAARLAQLRAETGLKMPDCCVLLAAEATSARLASFDGQLIRAAQGRNLSVVGH